MLGIAWRFVYEVMTACTGFLPLWAITCTFCLRNSLLVRFCGSGDGIPVPAKKTRYPVPVERTEGGYPVPVSADEYLPAARAKV